MEATYNGLYLINESGWLQHDDFDCFDYYQYNFSFVSVLPAFLLGFRWHTALITIGNSGILDKSLNQKYFRDGALVISIMFFARAVGDFKFVGFFKMVKATRFAINDTQIFSPLCVLIGVIILLIFVFKKTE